MALQQGYWYLGALISTVVFAVVWRVKTDPRRPADTAALSVTELAFLRSQVAPVVTALAGLRAGGRIGADGRPDPTVCATTTDTFSERVFAHVSTNPGHTVASLVRACRHDLAAMENNLASRGLVRTESERMRMRLGVLPSVAVTAGGIALVVHGVVELPVRAVERDAVVIPVILFPTLLCAVLVAPALLTVKRLTRAGRELLIAEQKKLSYLAPAKRPAFGTYGPASVAMSAALFGTGALWLCDPAYATAVDLAGSSNHGGGSSCGGSSCGGDGGGGGGCGGCGGSGGGAGCGCGG